MLFRRVFDILLIKRMTQIGYIVRTLEKRKSWEEDVDG